MMAEPRYSDERQQFLERLARGRCSAVSRRANLGFNVRWFPTIDGDPVGGFVDGFANKSDANAAAKQFREQCRQQLAETNGSM